MELDVCGPPPLPPPLPPLRSSGTGSSLELELTDHLNKVSKENVLHQESSDSTIRRLVENIQCTRINRVENAENSPVYLSFFKAVSPIIQVGPSCGLVALAMAGQLLGGGNLDVEQVISAAMKNGYTRYGEMFSADNLLALALQFLPSCRGKLLLPEVSRHDKLLTICDILARGGAVLMPYDRDANNEPCLKQGIRAHWALLTGMLLNVNPCDLASVSHVTHEADPEISCLRHAHIRDERTSLNIVGQPTYVFVVHGRTTRVSLWSLHELLESNDQLINMDPKKQSVLSDGDVNSEFILPDGGVRAGLCGKIVLLTTSKFDPS